MRPMSRLTVLCLVLLASRGLAEDGRAPTWEWRLASRTGACTVLFTSGGAPAAIDFTGSGGQFRDEPHELARFKRSGLSRVAVLPDASTAFAGLLSGEVWKWDLRSGERTRASSGHTSTIACAIVSPDGRLVATGS